MLVLNADTGASIIQDNTVTSAKIVDNSLSKTDTAFANIVPCFSAYLNSNLALTSGAITKMPCNIVEFDTTNAYDETTNFRFQPTVAGYYMVSANVLLLSSSVSTGIYSYLYKNGVEKKRGDQRQYPSTTGINSAAVRTIVYLNGTTDYLEFMMLTAGTSLYVAGNAEGSFTYFQAHLIVGA